MRFQAAVLCLCEGATIPGLREPPLRRKFKYLTCGAGGGTLLPIQLSPFARLRGADDGVGGALPYRRTWNEIRNWRRSQGHIANSPDTAAR